MKYLHIILVMLLIINLGIEINSAYSTYISPYYILYLNQIADKFTNPKIINVPKLVISAINSIFPIIENMHDKNITIKMAVQGVPFFVSIASF